MLPFLVTLHSFSEYRIQSRDSSNTVVTFLHSVVRFARLSYRGDTGILFKIAPRLNSSMFKNIFVLEGVLILHKKSECKSFAHFAQANKIASFYPALTLVFWSKFHPVRLFDFVKIPPCTLIRACTLIRDTRVEKAVSIFSKFLTPYWRQRKKSYFKEITHYIVL